MPGVFSNERFSLIVFNSARSDTIDPDSRREMCGKVLCQLDYGPLGGRVSDMLFTARVEVRQR